MTLIKYEDVPAQYKQNLLLGNGFSIDIHPQFKYDSLYNSALELGYLKEEDIKVFKEFDTKDFEIVLGKLNTAITVNKIYGYSNNSAMPGGQILTENSSVAISNQSNFKGSLYFKSFLEEKYSSIKNALHKIILVIHPESSSDLAISFTLLNSILLNFKQIFTLNYDVLCYWAIMQQPKQFTDFFKPSNNQLIFQPFDISLNPNQVPIYYLHGALHLYQFEDTIYKITSKNGKKLIETIFNNTIKEENTTPLFVSEGEYKHKLSRIANNAYLSFCYSSLRTSKGSITLHGVSLNQTDQHIIDALNKSEIKQIAYGIYKPDHYNNIREIEHRQYEIRKIFQDKEVLFYDSDSFLNETKYPW